MKKSSIIGFLYLPVLLGAPSCSSDQQQVHQWTREEANKLLGASDLANLVAAFDESGGHVFIIRNDSGSGARKLTLVPNFPTITDSLTQTGAAEFSSPKFHTSYLVNDSEVVATYHQKIIHPSSNWQGQTPWQETNMARYPRRDCKLNEGREVERTNN